MAVEGDDLSVGDVGEALHLEVLAHRREELEGVVARDLLALEDRALGEDLVHLRLDGHEVLRGEGVGAAEVVLELLAMVLAPGVDLDLGPQALYGVGHDVLGAVAQEAARLGVFRREDLEVAPRS